MLNLLVDYEKDVWVNGKHYKSGRVAYAAFQKYEGKVTIELNKPRETPNTKRETPVAVKKPKERFAIKVKKWMTMPSTPDFNFHDKFNDGKEMPLIIMEVMEQQGETKGMLKLKLRGTDIPMSNCMNCGRVITNKESLEYGIGPDCLNHMPFANKLRDMNDPETIKALSREVEWTGWVAKSAIKERIMLKQKQPA